jgi:Uma2 family endonuclease
MTLMAPTPVRTTADLLALPRDDKERWLIRGRLREKPMTRRNRWHGRIEAWIAHVLNAWLVQQPAPRGEVSSGEVGCILRRNPDTTVGIDVAYFSAEVVSRQTEETSMMDGPPVLAVEILSPSDKQEEIDEKLDEYLAAQVAQVWVIDPHDRTVTVYRPGAEAELFNCTHELSGEPNLPGLRVRVASIFP